MCRATRGHNRRRPQLVERAEVWGLPSELWVPRVSATPAMDTAAADEACLKLGALKEMLRDTLGMNEREGRGEKERVVS